jgi:transcriptional regulator with XRE-family HTH domain
MDTASEEFANAVRQAVASELRAARARKRMTVAHLVERSGIPESTLLRYLNGKRDVPATPFIQICAALDADPGTVMAQAAQAAQATQKL